ncbi:MAG: chemotaxis protein CheX [Nitrospinae bacterium]|nr:chemotaxis protein CheX [Nitrospinota bacterium]
MNVEFINPFLKATTNVLSMMAFVNPVAGKPFVKKDKVAKGDISGVIGLTGPTKGVVIFSLTKPAAIKIVNSMLSEKYTDLSEEVSDAIGELTNMISGDARRELAGKGFKFEAGLPSIVKGPGHIIETITKGPTIAIPFHIDGAEFVVETSFE